MKSFGLFQRVARRETSATKEVHKKRMKIAMKVVDILGNDKITIIDVAVGKEPRTQ